ncbi:hypothetical protein [Kitasatospora sp. NPDC058218]|uniref:vWA-MoxR associated conflict system protein n=1 Tax=Kitasatospora sp. NPDC058218 TaxID=3346385 RepID=UPI0036DB9C78
MSEAWQPPARHVLLIATQSDAAGEKLPQLESAADDLFRALTDQAIGGCLPSPAAEATRLRSGSVGRREIDEAVRAAVRAAGQAGATLVLAFLGHGQTPSNGARLWYMAADSEADEADSSVDVPALLEIAADCKGVAGVIAVIDTCHAEAAMPDISALIGGFNAGGKRIAVLAACGARQEAYGLSFTRELVATLTQGIPGEGEFLRTGVVKLPVAGRLKQQNVKAFEFDGDSDADGPLWLALNRQRPAWRPSTAIGRIGTDDLADALRSWPDAPAAPAVWTRQGLVELAAQAAGSGSGWAVDVAAGVVAAMDTGRLILESAGPALNTPLLRRLAADFNRQWADRLPRPVRPPAPLAGRPLLQHLLEHAALRTSMADSQQSAHLALAWYVVAAAEACGFDPSDSRVRHWAEQTGAEIALNDARAMHDENRSHGRALRLVVSLHAARVDWPDSLSACLRNGPDCVHHQHFPCVPDRHGVEKALPEVVAWAEDRLPGEAQLTHVDIVVPAPVLLDWHPEQTMVGMFVLGASRTVTLRWAGRLVVPGYIRGMNEHARTLLEKMDTASLDQGAPVDWVDLAGTGTPQLLRALQRGAYQRAIGIGHHPPHLQDLVTTLLPYTPILFWPSADADLSRTEWPCLAHLWETLPDGFSDAYRRRWHGPGDRDPATDGHLDDLADVRSAWHDRDWLDFCSHYTQHPSPAPRST